MSKEKRTLLVTGASSDVGSALIADIAQGYEYVWAHYCNSSGRIEALRERYKEKILPVRADFSSEESTAEMIRQIGETGKYPDHIVHLSGKSIRAG